MKSIKTPLSVLFAALLISLSGCDLNSSNNDCDSSPDLDVNETQLAADIAKIDAYLEANKIVAEKHPSGLRYIIKREGSGGTPAFCDNVSVTYEGRLIGSSTAFDSNQTPVSFPLSRLIVGWQVGIPLIKPGGRITLYIPSVYGYGATGAGSDIPPNSNLQFEVLLF